jgi:hypothetical protein
VVAQGAADRRLCPMGQVRTHAPFNLVGVQSPSYLILLENAILKLERRTKTPDLLPTALHGPDTK